MGPIKKFFWERKYKGRVDSISSVQFLQTLAKLNLWAPSDRMRNILASRMDLHRTMNEMLRELDKL